MRSVCKITKRCRERDIKRELSYMITSIWIMSIVTTLGKRVGDLMAGFIAPNTLQPSSVCVLMYLLVQASRFIVFPSSVSFNKFKLVLALCNPLAVSYDTCVKRRGGYIPSLFCRSHKSEIILLNFL